MNNESVQKMRSSAKHIGTWLAIGSPIIDELAASFPFDWLLLDLEHGYTTEASLLSNLQALKCENIVPIVRIGEFDLSVISHCLDWGAGGIMLPHVDSALRAVQCVSAMQYPPLGLRGYSSSARSFTFGLNKATDISKIPQPLFFAQIESCKGAMNAKNIASVPGVDILFVGPSDLKLDFSTHTDGIFGDFDAILVKIIADAKACNKQAGILAKTPDDLKKYLAMGFTVIAYGSDLLILRQGFDRYIEILG